MMVLGRLLGAVPLKVWLVLIGTGVIGAGGWFAWQEYRAALTDASSAQQALDSAQAENAQRQLVIDALWQNAQRLEDQRRQLAETKADLTRTASNRLAHIRELQHDNDQIRRWADTRLPDRVSRLRERPAVTGAAAYHQSVLDAQPVHATGQPPDD
ncbi:Rz-like lysis system protein LysB [Chromohalobacter nigrandesensis]|uniref:Rz-like lysis system protein LysB n=1 Tax=Chromohalobacter nigrandesensis TaxID=119863 RepID=UPI001FF1B273|nr:Rz-like lysis system protein LysB [Chromohalobacter nigrandesensis]MCK0744103.1 Rz-like lysis system protein LysB [Chromohalobacter nigrandesensis]